MINTNNRNNEEEEFSSELEDALLALQDEAMWDFEEASESGKEKDIHSIGGAYLAKDPKKYQEEQKVRAEKKSSRQQVEGLLGEPEQLPGNLYPHIESLQLDTEEQLERNATYFLNSIRNIGRGLTARIVKREAKVKKIEAEIAGLERQRKKSNSSGRSASESEVVTLILNQVRRIESLKKEVKKLREWLLVVIEMHKKSEKITKNKKLSQEQKLKGIFRLYQSLRCRLKDSQEAQYSALYDSNVLLTSEDSLAQYPGQPAEEIPNKNLEIKLAQEIAPLLRAVRGQLSQLVGSDALSYEVIAQIGEGGFGEVFKVRDPRLHELGENHILKVIRVDSQEDLMLLESEMKAAKALIGIKGLVELKITRPLHWHEEIKGLTKSRNTKYFLQEMVHVDGDNLEAMSEAAESSFSYYATDAIAKHPKKIIEGDIDALYAGRVKKHREKIFKNLYILEKQKYWEDLPDDYQCDADSADAAEIQKALANAEELTVAEIMADACRILSQIHEKGYVHRDIKPENVMLNKAGEVVLIDLGLSEKERVYSPAEDSYYRLDKGGRITEKTKVKNAVGTSGYMPPEALTERQFTREGDVFAMGVTLSRVLAGKRAYEATKEVVEESNIVNGKLTLNLAMKRPHISDAILLTWLDALSLDPDDRPTAIEMAEQLEDAIEQAERPVGTSA